VVADYLFCVATPTTRRAAWLESSSQTCCSNNPMSLPVASLSASDSPSATSNGLWQTEQRPAVVAPYWTGETIRLRLCFAKPQVYAVG
jgi:hypothetical protein